MAEYTDPAASVRSYLKRNGAPRINPAALPGREPTGAEIAAAALSALMEDWSPADRAETLDALAADLADGGSIAVSYARDDEEDWR